MTTAVLGYGVRTEILPCNHLLLGADLGARICHASMHHRLLQGQIASSLAAAALLACTAVMSAQLRPDSGSTI